MSGLTKEQLKNELINHGVALPAASARKEEYVKLYEQHVAPVASQKGDFSSDEEDSQVKVEVTYENSSVVIEGPDVSSLTDDELYQKLKELGVPIGPVVDSTRGFYQRKLASLLSTKASGESRTNGQFNGEKVNEEEFSDQSDVEDVKPEEDSLDAPVAPEAPITKEEPVLDEPPTAIRRRAAGTDHLTTTLPAQPLVDRQGTPIPRPSIHSVASSGTSYSFEPRRLASSAVPARTEPVKTQSRSYRIIVPMLLLLLVVAVYFAYQYVDKAIVLQQFDRLKSAVKNLWSDAKHVVEEVDHAEANLAPEV